MFRAYIPNFARCEISTHFILKDIGFMGCYTE